MGKHSTESLKGHAGEISAGERYSFGKNWKRFLGHVDEGRINEAEKSLRDLLKVDSLKGKRFLDIGCGSGLFSLAARRTDAAVFSFDYDPDSVACAKYLKGLFFPGDDRWEIQEGSVLDGEYVSGLGTFDVVYSWGVLHHTGDMWRALENAALPVNANGFLCLALYNDQGLKSRYWRFVKRIFCSGFLGRTLVRVIYFPYFVLLESAAYLLRGKNPLRLFRDYRQSRGMSLFVDIDDWLGGYPFETARVDEVFHFFSEKGFLLINLNTVSGIFGTGSGNNEFVFQKKTK